MADTQRVVEIKVCKPWTAEDESERQRLLEANSYPLGRCLDRGQLVLVGAARKPGEGMVSEPYTGVMRYAQGSDLEDDIHRYNVQCWIWPGLREANAYNERIEGLTVPCVDWQRRKFTRKKMPDSERPPLAPLPPDYEGSLIVLPYDETEDERWTELWKFWRESHQPDHLFSWLDEPL